MYFHQRIVAAAYIDGNASVGERIAIAEGENVFSLTGLKYQTTNRLLHFAVKRNFYLFLSKGILHFTLIISKHHFHYLLGHLPPLNCGLTQSQSLSGGLAVRGRRETPGTNPKLTPNIT